MTKLSPEDIEQIELRLANGEALQSIGLAFGVSKQTIWNIKHGKYSIEFRSGAKSARDLSRAKRPFADLTSDEIAEQVEKDIRSAARRWKKRTARRGKRASVSTAAIAAAALYLQKHHELYFREETQAMRDAHQQWMELMREWFISTVEGKKVHV